MTLLLTLALLSPLPPDGVFDLKAGALKPTVSSWGPDCGPKPGADPRRAGGYTLQGGRLTPEGRGAPLLGPGVCQRLTGLPYIQEQLSAGQARCSTPAGVAKKVQGRARLTSPDVNTLHLSHDIDFDWALKGSSCKVRFSGRLTLTRRAPIVEAVADVGVVAAPIKPKARKRPQPGEVEANPDLAAAAPTASAEEGLAPSQAGAGLSGRTTETDEISFPWLPVFGGLILAALLLFIMVTLRRRARLAKARAFRREALSSLDEASAIEFTPAPRAPRGIEIPAFTPKPASEPAPKMELLPEPASEGEALSAETTRPMASGGAAVHTCPECERSFDLETRFCPFDGAQLEQGRIKGEASPGDPLARACPECGRRWPAHVIYCPEDGAALNARRPQQTLICPKCGKRYPMGTQFCGHDGGKLVLLN